MKWLHLALVGALVGHAAPCFAWTESGLIALARDAVKREVLHQKPPTPTSSEAPLPVFVTIERHGQILGCRGVLRPTQSSLQREIVRAARSAASSDPRYRPLSPADLNGFQVTVSVVERQTPLEISELGSLSPEDGLVLQSGERVGIVLPFEGRDPQTRLRWAWKKAGLSPGSPVRLFRLQAQRFRG